MTVKALVTLLFILGTPSVSLKPAQLSVQVEVVEAPPLHLPGGADGSGGSLSVDSNSPVEWDSDGQLLVFTSSQRPFRSTSSGLSSLSWPALPVYIEPRADVRGGQWIEATYRAADGRLYGWYHNEPPGLCGSSSRLTAPRIGALVSEDDGQTWRNLGIVLDAPAGSLNCGTQNYYFAGGNGDFSVLLDQAQEYLYFFISTYHKQFNEQGVAVARMRLEDRDDPAGKVWKWYNGEWSEPGLGGHVTTSFPAMVDWHRANANAFWGAAVHYNAFLNKYVMLLNHAVDKNWAQEGIYVAYNDNLADPHGWSMPERLPISQQQLGWYPQVIGINDGETDKLVGQTARLFISGHSYWEISFYPTDNPDPVSLPIPTRRVPTDNPILPSRGN
jgi:hypothetical protein